MDEAEVETEIVEATLEEDVLEAEVEVDVAIAAVGDEIDEDEVIAGEGGIEVKGGEVLGEEVDGEVLVVIGEEVIVGIGKGVIAETGREVVVEGVKVGERAAVVLAEEVRALAGE